MATTRPAALAYLRQPTGGWLRGPAWDLTFISLSAVLVGLPFTAYQILTLAGLSAGASASVVDLVVTLLIGGPHLYATFTRTLADPNFRQHHRRIVATSALIPVGVVALGLTAFPILLTIFFFWASIHFLHQIVFLVECYNRRGPHPYSWFERGTDYAVLCTIGAGAIIGVLLLLRGPLGLSPEQPFYITMLSFLLIHYYHDHVLFTDPEAIVAERTTPAESRYAS